MVLPPGYEDEMWCPLNFCKEYVPHSNGMVGPRSMFWKCVDPQNNQQINAIWTGTKRPNVVPANWSSNVSLCSHSNLKKSGKQLFSVLQTLNFYLVFIFVVLIVLRCIKVTTF